ncbi:unnamed protein product [Protopolystoma xenopodis]|uniref:Uncharacterized protein n=1 Tax=Protopolystoma xenopodis TaxID=117903 RepID=A0A3S4ZYP1_9PLAT|nr:unnamed protein product [Protopolystoma xenopodis]
MNGGMAHENEGHLRDISPSNKSSYSSASGVSLSSPLQRPTSQQTNSFTMSVFEVGLQAAQKRSHSASGSSYDNSTAITTSNISNTTTSSVIATTSSASSGFGIANFVGEASNENTAPALNLTSSISGLSRRGKHSSTSGYHREETQKQTVYHDEELVDVEGISVENEQASSADSRSLLTMKKPVQNIG